MTDQFATELEAYASCPGYETSPNPCRCPCYGCKHHCSAHQAPAPTPDPSVDRRERYAEAIRRELTRYARTDIDPGTGSDVGDQVAIVMGVRDQELQELRAAITRFRHVADLIEAGAPWTASNEETARRLRDAPKPQEADRG